MYVGRDFTELSMLPKSEWTEKELAYFHHSLQQMVPYLNSEGVTIHNEIVVELMDRGGLTHTEATWTSGTRIHFD
ncbi:cytosolic protein [Evansella sp. AB-rgal1]|uniref:cytosolic protein n=1 Tax=Evansella sp. AB-rgal1 TaxID=3242696 RepID=UPI00359CDDF7